MFIPVQEYVQYKYRYVQIGHGLKGNAVKTYRSTSMFYLYIYIVATKKKEEKKKAYMSGTDTGTFFDTELFSTDTKHNKKNRQEKKKGRSQVD